MPPRDAQRKRDVFVGVDVDARCGIGVRERLFDERRQLLEALRADDDVDQVRALEQRPGFLLRHTAGNGYHGRAARLSTRLTHFPESRVELVFGPLAHAARVDHDHIGIARLRRRLVAGLLQQPRHPLGVVDVHLAAVRLDEIFQGFAFASNALRFWFMFAFAQQLPRGCASGVRGRRSSNHTRQLFDPPRFVQPHHLRVRAAVRDALRNMEVHVTGGRDLRQMRDAQHLERLPEAAELLPHDVGDPPADARVDLIEDKRLAGRGRGRQRSDREHHTRELSSARNARERPHVFSDVGREIALGHIDAGFGPRALGRFRLESHVELRAPHRQLAEQRLDSGAELLRRLRGVDARAPGRA